MDRLAEAIDKAAEKRAQDVACAVQVFAADLVVLEKYSKLMGWTTSCEGYQTMLKEISASYDARCAEIEQAYNVAVMPAVSAINTLLESMAY